MFNSIRWRLTVLMITLVILPSIAVGAILTYEAFNANRSQAEDLQSQVALRLADKIETTISERPRELPDHRRPRAVGFEPARTKIGPVGDARL